jgi:hypothetical protein
MNILFLHKNDITQKKREEQAYNQTIWKTLQLPIWTSDAIRKLRKILSTVQLNLGALMERKIMMKLGIETLVTTNRNINAVAIFQSDCRAQAGFNKT